MKKIPITELTRDYQVECVEESGSVAYYLVAKNKRYLLESKTDDEAVAEIKTIDKRLRGS